MSNVDPELEAAALKPEPSSWLDKLAEVVSLLGPDDDLAALDEVEGVEVGQVVDDVNARVTSGAYEETRGPEFGGSPGQSLRVLSGTVPSRTHWFGVYISEGRFLYQPPSPNPHCGASPSDLSG